MDLVSKKTPQFRLDYKASERETIAPEHYLERHSGNGLLSGLWLQRPGDI